jgi:hypothetical protein
MPTVEDFFRKGYTLETKLGRNFNFEKNSEGRTVEGNPLENKAFPQRSF